MHILHFLHQKKMILDLTIENLLKSGCNTYEANELYNKSDNNILQCNNGNFYVCKTENKIYTGIDFYRKTYFDNGNLRFPLNCPDLAHEYFDLALTEFLQEQKKSVGMLFDEKNQIKKFISNEIERTIDIINNTTEYLSKMKPYRFKNKEVLINVCESYINFLKAKEIPQQPKAVKPDEVKKEFKDFFNPDVSINVIETIQSDFKDYKGKKMAYIVYLLETNFKIITYSLNGKNDSRKHFVEAMINKTIAMQGINKYFESNDVKLNIYKFEKASDYVSIKEKLLKTII